MEEPLKEKTYSYKHAGRVTLHGYKDISVPGAGYSPGAFQRRILCLLNGSLRLLTVRIDDGIYKQLLNHVK